MSSLRFVPIALAIPLAIGAAMGHATAAAPMGAARARPYEEAVVLTRQAATAVLARSGRESCLRGKLTGALLGLSASCEAGNHRNALCDLADRAVVVPVWSLPFMDETARQLLEATRGS